MYALINTMPAVDTVIGRVISVHRTDEAAEKADAKVQRMTKAANGQSSYLPTRVVRLAIRAGAGALIDRSEIVTEEE